MTDKVALITGGGRGMGAATARELANRDYKLVLMSPSDSCDKLVRKLGGVVLRQGRRRAGHPSSVRSSCGTARTHRGYRKS